MAFQHERRNSGRLEQKRKLFTTTKRNVGLMVDSRIPQQPGEPDLENEQQKGGLSRSHGHGQVCQHGQGSEDRGTPGPPAPASAAAASAPPAGLPRFHLGFGWGFAGGQGGLASEHHCWSNTCAVLAHGTPGPLQQSPCAPG